jgi:hypothetical protein
MIKIKKFKVQLLISDLPNAKFNSIQLFEMDYQKGVLLRTAYRDAILKMHKDNMFMDESYLKVGLGYSLIVTPLELIDSETVKEAKIKSEAIAYGKAKKPSKAEVEAFRAKLELDADMGGEDLGDDDEA